MSGVYGDQLSVFAEQFRTVSYFSMKQDVQAGYSNRVDLGKVRGVFQYMKKGELMKENDTLSDVNMPTFWTKKKLKAGNFIQRTGDEDEDIYRLVNPNDWKFEGNFYIYGLETVTGNTDVQEPFTEEEVNLSGGFN